MESNAIVYQTGSSPYYLNFSNTAKEDSKDDQTNPQRGQMELLLRTKVLVNNTIVEPLYTADNIIEIIVPTAD